MPPKRVLVIDDDDDIRDLLALIVQREGFIAETAWDGQQGLEAIEKSPPDLVIMDMMLPRYGGFELLRKLQEGNLSGLPIIVVTGRFNDSATTNMIRNESNVREFLAKPVDTSVLIKALHRLLG